MRGEANILVNCPIDTFLKEKQHSAMVSWFQVEMVLKQLMYEISLLEKEPQW